MKVFALAFLRNRGAVVGLVILLLVCAMAALAPVLFGQPELPAIRKPKACQPRSRWLSAPPGRDTTE